jgi:hypothetical protein
MTEADDDWILPIGERLDERHVRLILNRFDPDALRLGREIADAWRSEARERPVEGNLFGVRTLVGPHGFLCDPAHADIALGMVKREPSNGSDKPIANLLE